MIDYPIFYIFCYQDIDFDAALQRLKISISSIPNNKSVHILTWHTRLPSLNDEFSNVSYHFVDRRDFSKAFFINLIAGIVLESSKYNYFYLSDTDLYFHPSYFEWLDAICLRLDAHLNDLRIITLNFNMNK